MKKSIQYATAIFQNANVGMQSINDILPKVEDEDLARELREEYAEYERISEKLKNFAIKNDFELKENNFFEKAKMWISINMSTLANNTTRHIAELLLLGSAMGLTTCYKDKFDHKNTNSELDQILEELEQIQETNFNRLKTFLKDMS